MQQTFLAECYSEASKIDVTKKRKQEVLTQLKNRLPDVEPQEHVSEQKFNIIELEDALKTLSDDKSPGPDKITNAMLTHMGPKAKTKLLGIFNNSWITGQIPQTWRKASMVPILKKGKDKKQSSSYRPISLTSCVGKLMERIINARLSWFLEKDNVICKEQAGFRQNRSTEDQVTYIAQSIEDGFQEKKTHTSSMGRS